MVFSALTPRDRIKTSEIARQKMKRFFKIPHLLSFSGSEFAGNYKVYEASPSEFIIKTLTCTPEKCVVSPNTLSEP